MIILDDKFYKPKCNFGGIEIRRRRMFLPPLAKNCIEILGTSNISEFQKLINFKTVLDFLKIKVKLLHEMIVSKFQNSFLFLNSLHSDLLVT